MLSLHLAELSQLVADAEKYLTVIDEPEVDSSAAEVVHEFRHKDSLLLNIPGIATTKVRGIKSSCAVFGFY